jgi:hypothetical protein
VLIALVVWKPFDARLGGIVGRMNNHRQFVMDEFGILQLENLKQAEKTAAAREERAEDERRQEAEARKLTQHLSDKIDAMDKTMNEEIRSEILYPLLEGEF